MYQRNQQPNRDNYNNDDNYESSESDSDSDAEMEENQADGENDNNNENDLPNNEIEDDAQPHNGILERIDYLGRNDDDILGPVRNNAVNMQDDSRPVPFDDNSRGNFELPLLGERSACNINLEIPPAAVNDDSSRESMDLDYENDIPTLGNIIVERNLEKIEQLERAESNKEVNGDSDEEQMNNFFENDEFCTFMRNGGERDELNNCKCSKCTIKDRGDVNFYNNSNCCDEMDVCFSKRSRDENRSKRSLNKNSLSALSSSSSSCTVDDDRMPNTDDEEPPNSHNIKNTIHDSDLCDNNNISNCSKKSHINNDIDADSSSLNINNRNKNMVNKNCVESDDNEMENDAEDEQGQLECTCFENKLDHINGHSSKMCLELAKTPCKKCSLKEATTLTASINKTIEQLADDAHQIHEPPVPENVNVEIEQENENGIELAVPLQNRRPRDAHADPDNVRPNKRVKLNNGSAANRLKTPRTIFHRALDAVNMSWENQHLKNILASNSYTINSSNAVQTAGSSKPSQTVLSSLKSNFNAMGQPLWHEPLAMCAARIDSLRSHGHTDAALRLTVSVVRTMKQVQTDAQLIWNRYQNVVNIPCLDDSTKQAGSCCCDFNSSNNHPSNGNSNTNNSNNGSGGSSRKRSLDHGRGHSVYSSSTNGSNRDGYKMYRYDYGNNSSYRYGMGHESCKRCLEARERVGYQSTFNNGYHHPNRYNLNGGMQPTYFRNNFGGNLYDQRFGSNHFGSNSYRYGNYAPNIQHNGQCHAENCNLVHRSPNNMSGDPYGNLYNNNSTRPHCSKDLDKYFNHTNNNNGNAHNLASSHRCNQDLKLREMISAAPMNPRVSTECRNAQGDCRNCSNKPNEPSTSSAGGNSSATKSDQNDNEHQPGCSKDMAKPSSSKDLPKTTSDLVKKACTQHTKNQCCIKNFCCQTIPITEKSKCCSTTNSLTRCNCSTNNVNSFNGRQYAACSSSNNIYFGRNISFDLPSINHNCHSKPRQEFSCNCCRSSSNHGNSNHIANASTSMVNYGASTSKGNGASMYSTPSSEFQRNKKPGCASNCLDCSVGCEIEFPLDAVACIFDCLTEACIIPDAINGPDMGRLSFDSVPAAEDGNLIPPRYQHVSVPVSNDRNETYLTLAFEVSKHSFISFYWNYIKMRISVLFTGCCFSIRKTAYYATWIIFTACHL